MKNDEFFRQINDEVKNVKFEFLHNGIMTPYDVRGEKPDSYNKNVFELIGSGTMYWRDGKNYATENGEVKYFFKRINK